MVLNQTSTPRRQEIPSGQQDEKHFHCVTALIFLSRGILLGLDLGIGIKFRLR